MRRIIAIEGADRVGKATQALWLVHAIRKHGMRVRSVEIPLSDGITHRLLYCMLRSGAALRFPTLFQAAQILNRFVAQVWIVLLLVVYEHVILDRWHASSIVYGDATGTNRLFTRFCALFLVRPSLTIVLDNDMLHRPGLDDAFERNSDVQHRARVGYRKYVRDNPATSVLIDAKGTRDEVHERVWESCCHLM